MVSVIGAIIYAVLGGALAALAVAYHYERNLRKQAEETADQTGQSFNQMQREIISLNQELARLNGISIGRECDAMQRRFIENMTDNGQATVDLGRKTRRA